MGGSIDSCSCLTGAILMNGWWLAYLHFNWLNTLISGYGPLKGSICSRIKKNWVEYLLDKVHHLYIKTHMLFLPSCGLFWWFRKAMSSSTLPSPLFCLELLHPVEFCISQDFVSTCEYTKHSVLWVEINHYFRFFRFLDLKFLTWLDNLICKINRF